MASFPSRVSQKGVISVGLSDHRLNFCTWKISKFKTGGVHKFINFCSLKHNWVDDYICDAAYSYFFKKIMSLVDKITAFKAKGVRGNPKKWFDGDVLKKLNSWDKLYQKFKKSWFHNDYKLWGVKIDCNKKENFF